MPAKVDLDLVTDEDFLDAGKVPQFVADCKHSRMWKAPPKGLFGMTACKDCGRVLISDLKGNWEEGRDSIELPVTLEKLFYRNCVAAMRRPYPTKSK